MKDVKLKIGFLSEYAPTDRRASSGTSYKMAEQLSKIGTLKWIPIKRNVSGRIIEKVIKAISAIVGKKFELVSTLWGSQNAFAPILTQEFEDVDIIAAFFCSPILAHIKTDKPIVYFTDAVYPTMVDYYWCNRWSFNNIQGVELEKRAVANTDAIIVASKWCADSLKNDLDTPMDKVNVIEYGANIDEDDLIRNDTTKRNDIIEILFLGVEWERKGGDLAVQTINWLNHNNVNARLNIVGIRELPAEVKSNPYVVSYGFLNKNIPSDYKLLCDIIAKCHIELLPTKAEAAGIAFAEAAAYGIPCFTHDTGGVGNYVINGINGYRLPLGSTAEDFGRCIKKVWDKGEIQTLSAYSIELYKSTLNWNVWGEKASKVLQSVTKH